MNRTQETPFRIFISVGDPSGDVYAAKLIKHLFKHPKCPKNLLIDALGGPHMKAAGATLLEEVASKSTIGFIEPLRYLKGHLNTYKRACHYLKQQRPTVFLAIDHQGFNMKLIKTAKSLNIQTAYFICPQEWQWGSKKNGQNIAKLVDKLFCIFPQEEAFYKACAGKTYFVGHPIFETLPILNKQATKDTLLILPGSRKQEIKHLKDVFAKSIQRLSNTKPELNVSVSISHPSYKKPLKKAFKGLPVSFFEGSPSEALLSRTKAALACSGTVTLTLALLGIPTVVAYKFHPLSYAIGKRLLAHKLDQIRFIALPNVILDHTLFEEFIQNDAHDHALYEALKRCLETTSQKTCQFSQNKSKLEKLLANQKACQQVADHLIDTLNSVTTNTKKQRNPY